MLEASGQETGLRKVFKGVLVWGEVRWKSEIDHLEASFTWNKWNCRGPS
jgi:hypothetical protein